MFSSYDLKPSDLVLIRRHGAHFSASGRASVHYYNDSHDIDRLMATLTRSDTGGHVGGDSCDGDGHGDGVTSTPRPKL